jgi:lysophospholipase
MNRIESAAEAMPTSQLAKWAAAKGLPVTAEAWWRTPDGVRLRHAHWRTQSAERRGVAVVLGGRTEFIEKNLETCRDLLANGFDVWSLDWRGQGLSDRLCPDPHKGHVADYQDYLDDLDGWLRAVTDLPARRDLKLMIAHSMGGHIGLRYLHDQPAMFDAAAFSAPMVDLSVNIAPLRLINAWRLWAGLGETYAALRGRYRPWYNGDGQAPTPEDYRAAAASFRILTSDARRMHEVESYIRQNPALALGGPTSGWLQASFESISILLSPGYAEAIATPVLIVGAGRDQVVITARQEELAKRMPNARFHLIAEAAHEILAENDRVRAEFFAELGKLIEMPFTLPPPDLSGYVPL